MRPQDDIIKKISRIPPQKLQLIAKQKIFFGHQSVGRNILDGLLSLDQVLAEVVLEIKEYTGHCEEGAFFHAPIGRNADPESKINGFVEYMQNGLGNAIDIAFFKFCYVDITSNTDVSRLFNIYHKAMVDLAVTYPATKFIQVTVPLTVVQKGPRAWVKKLIGRPIGGYNDNVQRNRFNDLLRQKYQGKAPIFDLALIEATRPNGKLNFFKQNGKNFHALVPQYASDGRHLNQYGARLAAAEILKILEEVITLN